ncbi:MAG: choice-of-anchor L domain-containing protein [Flavobacteriales bacterium]|nr:choice-of-anchor L domain-containing protein [Flavobacteriales bacterium]
MIRKYVLAILAGALSAGGNGLRGQLITTTQTADNLVQNVLLGGGVEAFNITYHGAPSALGFFNGTGTNIGLSSGVIMTTGNISGNADGPKGPNNKDDAGFDNGSAAPPPPTFHLLSNLIGSQALFNSTVVRFDFIPTGNTVSFRYVFGSEEYPEYVGSIYNDVFGFFISGPGISGWKNIATIPGSNTEVSINSVNNGSSNTGPCTNCAYYVNNTGGATIQYDGFTKVLTAQSAVIPCSTYTIILAIADVGDPIYDSGVFLEAKSFTTNSISVKAIISSAVAATNDLYEGCGSARFIFTRSGDLSASQTLNLAFSGSATLADFTPPFPSTVTFAPGVSEVEVEIFPVNDGITEGPENFRVTILNATPCPTSDPPSAEVVVNDAAPLQLSLGPDIYLNCYNQEVLLAAQITGGTYNQLTWSTGSNDPSIVVKPMTTTTYWLLVTDLCTGETERDSITVHIPPYQPLTLVSTPDTGLCASSTLLLTAQASGGIGPLTLQWSTGAVDVPSVEVFVEGDATYWVSVTDSCQFTVQNDIHVTVLSPQADFSYYYKDNHIVQFTDHSTGVITSWFWDFGDGGFDTVQHPLHEFQDTGLFYVMLVVENQFGCPDTAIKPVRSYPPFEFFIPNTFTPNADGLNETFMGKGQGFVECRMRIYDRWGQKIFETDSYGRGWNGKTRNGKDYPIGTYVYQFELRTPPGKRKYFIGHVNLVR